MGDIPREITPVKPSIMKRSRVAAGCTALAMATALAMYIASISELYLPFNPGIDTVYAAGFSEARFDDVHPGMSAVEVRRLLGPPLHKSAPLYKSYPPRLMTQHSRAVEAWSYTGDGACTWGDFAWLGRYVYFDENGLVTETERRINRD
jgi:hypothetical protein